MTLLPQHQHSTTKLLGLLVSGERKLRDPRTILNLNRVTRGHGGTGEEAFREVAKKDENEHPSAVSSLLTPSDVASVHAINAARAAEESRQAALRSALSAPVIVKNIPPTLDALLRTPVPWSILDSSPTVAPHISAKLEPFVRKKVKEVMGLEEDSLVFFVMELLVSKRSDLRVVLDELRPVLGEATEDFVVKCWKTLWFWLIHVKRQLEFWGEIRE